MGTVMVTSGKICAKYVARLVQSEAIPWSTKLEIPKKTASNRSTLSNITVATFTGVLSATLQVKPILQPSPWQDPSWPFC